MLEEGWSGTEPQHPVKEPWAFHGWFPNQHSEHQTVQYREHLNEKTSYYSVCMHVHISIVCEWFVEMVQICLQLLGMLKCNQLKYLNNFFTIFNKTM